MKITLIIEHFDPSRGGAERFTVWLVGELVKRGHDVQVVCHDVAPHINRYRQATQRASHDARRSTAAVHLNEEDLIMQGVQIHKLKGLRLNTGIGFRLFARKAARFLKQHPSDLSHSMTIACMGDIYQPYAGVYAEIQLQAIASRRSAAAGHFKRVMLQFSSKQRTLLAMERNAVRSHPPPYRILCLCPMISKHFHKHYGQDRKSGLLVDLPGPFPQPLGVADPVKVQEDRDWFRGNYGLEPDDRVAVFVGHDFRRKGLRYAIEAVARTSRGGGWKLLVVGLGKAREYVELANSLGIGDDGGGGGTKRRILFVGPTREMDKVYAAADALILPTFYDPFARVVLEALSHGMPVISTEYLGASDLVKDHHAGTIVGNPREVDQMAGALEALPAPKTPERGELAQNARAASARMFPEKYVEKLLSLYEQVQREKREKSKAGK
ncbi:MAG: glycosyltransferase family 4 protein [Phycisphaerales bacterium]|nr:glycosyltransferase family 4 protein [Phycisphaerales bacterium]